MNINKNKLRTVVAGLATSFFLSAAPTWASDFAGKTVTIFIGNPAGSGGDVHGRVFARHFGNHILGSPNVIVVNKGGGGGTTAMNHVYESGAQDGTMLCYCNFNAAAVIAQAPGIRYVPEEMSIVGSSSSDLAFVARRDRVSVLSDIKEGEPILVGGRGAASNMGMMGNLGLKVMGATYRYIPGFKGFSKISAAMMAGEVGAGHAGLTGFQKFFGDGEIAYPVYFHPHFDKFGSLLPDEGNTFPSDVPSIMEAHEALYGSSPTGKWWDAYVWYRSKAMSATVTVTGPPGIDEETVRILQEAYQATVTSEEFLTEYRATVAEPPTFNSTETTIRAFTEFRSVPDDVAATLIELANE